ncbi:MAG: TRAP transporter fused permease subunit, partial [Solibacillus sp.]
MSKNNDQIADNQFDQISAEDQQALLEKYDIESNTRNVDGIMKKVIYVGLLLFSLFQVYTAVFGVFPAQIQRTIHLGFGLTFIFLLFPAVRKTKKDTIPFYDYILALVSIVVGSYWVINYERLVQSLGRMETMDFYIGLIAIILVLEAARRAVGLPITIIASLFLLYAYFGQHMPDFMAHRGQSVESIVNLMFYSTDGILGTPISVSATFIFVFLLFGAFLVKTGVGQYFNDLAVALAGKLVGGPAKVAIFSSALQGTISGSSVANVVTSGSYTIPMMKKLGYKKEFAGAVEAAASTGGQLMPPIMGAAAFLMVEFIGRGVTYWDIAKAAAIPALLYFTGIWIMTHFEAKRLGLRGLSDEELPNR